MPIAPFLNDERPDPETKRVLGVAFEMTCIARCGPKALTNRGVARGGL